MKILSCVLALSVALICFSGCEEHIQTYSGKESLTVVIDAGHGGVDGGVSGTMTNVKESDLNLEIAKELRECFFSGGFNVVMTRETSAGLYGVLSKGFKKRDMEKRKEIINSANADLMVSVHINFFSASSRRGAQVFYREGDENSRSLALFVQERLNVDQRDYSPLAGDYYVLNETNCLAILCECGFLSNPSDEQLLLTEEFRKKIAYRIYKGCALYLLDEA